jgi:hypothetical protein
LEEHVKNYSGRHKFDFLQKRAGRQHSRTRTAMESVDTNDKLYETVNDYIKPVMNFVQRKSVDENRKKLVIRLREKSISTATNPIKIFD